MTRREALARTAGAALAAGACAAPPMRAPVINAAEHVWVINDPKFPIDPQLATCPTNLPGYAYSGEWLLDEMKRYNVDHVVISHVCYYGRNNAYTSYCVRKWPTRFAGCGLLVGYRLYPPSDKENASRLEHLVKEDGLIGLRLSPIYDRDVVWLNDPDCYPLWKKVEELRCVFHIFLAPLARPLERSRPRQGLRWSGKQASARLLRNARRRFAPRGRGPHHGLQDEEGPETDRADPVLRIRGGDIEPDPGDE